MMSSVDLDDTPSAPPATQDEQEPSAPPAAVIHDTLPTTTDDVVSPPPAAVEEKVKENVEENKVGETLDEIPLDDDDDINRSTPSAPPVSDVVPIPSPSSLRTDEPAPTPPTPIPQSSKEEMKTSPSSSTPTKRNSIKVPALQQRELEFYGQLYRALDYSDTDSISYDDVNTFLKRSKLPDSTIREAWSLSRKGKQAPKQQLYREQFFVCLKLVALAQRSSREEGDVTLLQLCQRESKEDATTLQRLPLPNFGLRACAAAEALTSRSEVDRAIKRASDLNEARGGLSVHLPKHDTTDHTS
jgi:hypothetical protein